jgi:hypothetical protein
MRDLLILAIHLLVTLGNCSARVVRDASRLSLSCLNISC